MKSHAAMIEQAFAEWGDPFVARAVFSTVDPSVIAAQVDSFCRAQLGSGVAGALFVRESIGSVHGLVLDDGRQVVLKAHQPTADVRHLRTVQEVVGHLWKSGFPAPRPLVALAPLARGHAWVEEMLDRGAWEDPHRPEVRLALAAALAEMVQLCRPFAVRKELRPSLFSETPGSLWPVPHSKLFDFEKTARGAEAIDALAHEARARLAQGQRGALVVGHHDLRAEHVRFERRDGTPALVATYDWDSLAREHETSLVGMNAHAFTADWSTDPPLVPPAPSLEEARAYVAAYETARGRAFTPEERASVGASFAYAVAYTARCGHSIGAAGDEGSYLALAHQGRALFDGWT